MNIKNATLIDVRTPEEYKEEHLPGAINIPLDQVPQRLDELRSLPVPLVAYCRSGTRSGMAVSLMKQNGILKVYNGGGLEDLKRNPEL